MDPYSGKIYTDEQVEELRKTDPDKAARLVMMQGELADIQRIGKAVAGMNRAERRAAGHRGPK